MRVHKTDDISFPRFSVAHSGTFVSDSLCIITGSDLHYLTGILNSTYGENYFRKNIAILDNGGMQMRQQYVENILIPPITPSNKGIVEKIERIVEKILSAKKQNPAADTSQPEREINRLIYQLYGLTDDEIKIIENANDKQ
jgi:type II restriction/modification system DNA methylase subunit YeeA